MEPVPAPILHAVYASFHARASSLVCMDPLSGLLDRTRARGAFVLCSTLAAPWSIRVEDRAPLTLVAVIHGAAAITTGAGTRAELREHDIALLRGPEPYVVADPPSASPQVSIGPDQVCSVIDPAARPMGPLGVRSWGNDPAGETTLLTGTYHTPAEISRSLLTALPDLLVMRSASWANPFAEHLMQEADRDTAGQDVVLDRLLDLVLIAAVQTWLAQDGSPGAGWYAAHDDPVVGPALALIHTQPGHPWTVASLAAAAGCSRAGLADRFTRLVGQAPMAYLTGWRLSHAADLLTTTDATLEAIARQVGYSSAFAFSAAFKRTRGVSPSRYRQTQ
jgi:AraC-like DNA-binding protein